MGWLIGGLTVATAFLWLMLATENERQWVLDNVCPKESPVIRYPAHLGGPRPAVCKPTGIKWR